METMNSAVRLHSSYRQRGHRLSALVVDDCELNRLLATYMLSREGFDVDSADNGLVAIEILKNKPYDFVLMDLQMPVMDGYCATSIIRDELHLKTPVIGFSGSINKNEIMQCYKSGMTDYINKPFTTETLTNTLRKHKLNEPKECYRPSSAVNETSGKALLYSLDKLKLSSQGNNLFVKKMVGVFCNTMPQQVRSMVMALSEKDYPTIKSVAHKIKPAINSLCIESLVESIRNLENLDPTMLDWANIQKMISEVKTILTEVIEGLSDYYQLRMSYC
jgi:CheY-like chemotaxis protein